MGFKEMVKADIEVFLNPEEFAEKHTIKFDGMTFEDIDVTLIKVKQSDRIIPKDDHMQGVHLVTAKAYFSVEDTDGKYPEHGAHFEIDDGEALGKPFFERYRVVTVENAMGMACLELELYDE
ncbi:MAG: hypothetical protein J1F04_01560 [Oscillospiraceae bacterium]|nr:hypothetical protein [Oscillospiraceae bacterium]